MKFQDLPNDAQLHALTTLREVITSGHYEGTELELAGKVREAFVSIYENNRTTTDLKTNKPSGPAIVAANLTDRELHQWLMGIVDKLSLLEMLKNEMPRLQSALTGTQADIDQITTELRSVILPHYRVAILHQGNPESDLGSSLQSSEKDTAEHPQGGRLSAIHHEGQ